MLFICSFCNNQFERSKRNSCTSIKKGCKPYCSKKCSSLGKTTKKSLNCTYCNKSFLKILSEIGNNNFCSRSCACTYNNLNKKHGNRRSKLESYLENQLNKLFPNLEILYNNKEAIKSELDIYIPSLKLAFELNGIFHYEPIYGPEKLTYIQNNDNRKFQACLERGIELCIIDTSSQTRFTEKSSQKYLEIIKKIINIVTENERIELSPGIKPDKFSKFA